MMACVTQSLPIILLSWQLSTAQQCSNFIIDHHALRNHVIQTLSVSNEDEYFTECEDSSQCVTINLVNLRCDLNSASHLSHPEDFLPDTNARYAVVKPLTICSNTFCSENYACAMNVDGRSYRCEEIPLNIYVKAAAFDDPGGVKQSMISINNRTFALKGTESFHRGHNFVVVRCDGSLVSNQTFDTHFDSHASTNLVNYLQGLPNDVIVTLAVKDEGSTQLRADAINALHTIIHIQSPSMVFRESMAFIGYKGATIPSWQIGTKKSSGEGPSVVTARICKCKTCDA
ncbi:predicted protein [Nematostella vectensis]|uniref:ILEI/PANDER domain-containing protein n=1 Tax=Nematostella vectensis TaxID=45351 RepID=A7SUF0_NEMVE|nr:predicted protein [Nematostella vectensis]|eukprot:XP_001624777.1 predicted protein [Nematostella vectensis]